MFLRNISIFLVALLFCQKSHAQCVNGQCYAPQSYQSYQNSSYGSYPTYYQNSPVYSSQNRVVYLQDASYIPQQVIQCQPQYIQSVGHLSSSSNYTQEKLVPVVRQKKTEQPAPQAAPTLEGPNQIKVGELAVLKVKNAVTKVAWIVIPQKINFQEFENGSSAAFSAPTAGTYSFFAAVGSGNDLVVLPHSLVVIDDRPSPTPPGPGPNPQPIDLKGSVKAAVAKVVSQKKATEAQYLAFSFISVANLIKTGALKDSNSIISVTTESNRQALGTAKDAWTPFFVDLQAILGNLSSSGQLSTPEQHQVVWQTIADVLKTTT